MADTSQVKEITSKLEQGVKDLFTSERYADYLKTMSRFHRYSTRNTVLIHMQRPNATHVAGFQAWINKFGRHVRKGEKSIKILAPVPFVKREEKEKLDPDTRLPIIGEDGLPVVEYSERRLARFKVTSVFDLSQTDGKPLPTLAQDLTGNVEQYTAFLDALHAVSPLPIVFEALPEDTDGTCRFGNEIEIRSGMSEIQTVCAVIHEITHAKLHDSTLVVDEDGDAKPKDRRTEEVEAESVSYAVCQYFGIETGDSSFGYLAEWSRTRDLKELNASLDTIRVTAADLIDAIDGKFREIVKERNITLTAGEVVEEHGAHEPEKSTIDEAHEESAAHESEKPPTELAVVSAGIAANQIYAKYANIVADRAAQFANSSGTLSYTDETAARIACDQIVYRVVNDMLLEAAEHYPLFKHFMEDSDFKARLEDHAYIKAYQEPRNAMREKPQQAKTGLEAMLYEKFAESFPKVASGEYRYMRLEAGDGFMPLSLEWINEDTISVMHTYSLNGDLCYDPMIVFRIGYSGEGENEVRIMTAVEYEQSIPPLYQVKNDDGRWSSIDGNGNEKSIMGLSRSINEFAAQWFENISQQGYLPTKANMMLNGDEIQITFDTAGNCVIPYPEKQEKEYRIWYGFLGDGITVWNQAVEKDGEYETIAHIGRDRSVSYYDSAMPEEIKRGIKNAAETLDDPALAPVVKTKTEDVIIAELTVPDPSIGFSEMNLYGYSGDEMLPMTQARAVELYDADHTIYLLYPDNTEAMVFDRDEIVNHDGIYGIERTDWEVSLEYAAMKAETKTMEGSREAELLYGSGNRFGIYQLREDDEKSRNFRFASLEELQSLGLDVERANYELVHTAPFPERIEYLTDRYPVLDRIYEIYNVNHPTDYTGSSVSVSDVIVLRYNGDISSHYVDTLGFVEIDYFLGEEKATLPEKAVRDIENDTPESFSQVGKRAEEERQDTPPSKPTLMERLAENKLKAAAQQTRHSETVISNHQEVRG